MTIEPNGLNIREEVFIMYYWLFKVTVTHAIYNVKASVRNCFAMIMAYLISKPQFNIWNISYITSHPFFTGSLKLTNDQLPTSVAS